MILFFFLKSFLHLKCRYNTGPYNQLCFAYDLETLGSDLSA